MLRPSRPELVVFAVGACALGVAAWRASSVERRDLEQRDRAAAVEAVRAFVSLSAHLRGSGGDRRFAERVPAAPAVVDELVADAKEGRRLGRLDQSRLVQADVRRVREVGLEMVEVTTKEYWVTRDSSDSSRYRSDVVPVRYVVRREGGAWRVVDWNVEAGSTEGGR